MHLYIIRHAQSSNNALPDERCRVHDPLLTGLGWRQAELLAQHLAHGVSREPGHPMTTPGTVGNSPKGLQAAGYGITRLFCSPMWRSLQTAQVVGPALGLTPEVWIDIHEQGGIWLDHSDGRGITGYPGITRRALRTAFPDYAIPEALTDEGWWRGAHEESAACRARAERVAQTLCSWPPGKDRIAIITHGAFITYLINTLLAVPHPQAISYHHDNCGISLVSFRPESRLSVRYLNRLDHLPPEMIT
jgi:2,3-bisphosphoglycerate-dependent phosphoglycerate mutase